MKRTRSALLVALALVVVTAVAYAPVLGNDFVNYDDDLYITDNPLVRHGLAEGSVAWAFTTFRGANWFPLTWLSWMTDATLYGVEARGFHATSLLLHCATSALLFAALLSLTGAFWRSAFVAGVFALHPLHVESVAWASARKDVLSGLCFALALLAWARYARGPSVARYAAVAACTALGLLAKPVLVTLPCVLLLLDVWPLRRLRLPFGPEPREGALGPLRAVAEKLPLVTLAAAASAVTYAAQESWGAVQSLERIPLGTRVANALVSYVAYVGSSLWPEGLTVFYPHPLEHLPGWQVAGAAGGLFAATAGALLCLRRLPFLAVGWLWYLGMLVPVIGLVQVGSQARADRYTYLSQIGLAIALAWGVGAWVEGRRGLRRVAAAAGALALAALVPLTAAQARHWRDSFTLFQHALHVTAGNYVAHINLGLAHLNAGRSDVASAHLEEALRLAPGSARAAGILGDVRRAQDRPRAALHYYQRALRAEPEAVRWHAGMADALLALERDDEAIERYRFALVLDPENAYVHGNLGLALYRRGDVAEAVAAYERALELRPGLATVRGNLGIALLELGREARAREELERVVAEQPESALVRAHLGRLHLRRGELQQARAQLAEAVRLEPGSAAFHALLAQVLQQLGRDAEATRHYRLALLGGERTPETLNNFAWLLATSRDARVRVPQQAVALAEEAARATHHRIPEVLDTLASAYAAAGRPADAERAAAQAAALAGDGGTPAPRGVAPAPPGRARGGGGAAPASPRAAAPRPAGSADRGRAR